MRTNKNCLNPDLNPLNFLLARPLGGAKGLKRPLNFFTVYKWIHQYIATPQKMFCIRPWQSTEASCFKSKSRKKILPPASFATLLFFNFSTVNENPFFFSTTAVLKPILFAYWCNFKTWIDKKIKSSLYSRYYTEACNEWRGIEPHISRTDDDALTNWVDRSLI